MRPLALAVALLASLAWSQEPGIALPPDLQRVLTDYEIAWRAKDAPALARLFAANGFVLSSGAPMVWGRAAIERIYTGSGGPLFLRAVAYATNGNVGYIIGGFTNRAGAPDGGKFTLTLQKDSTGRWLIMSDMDNGNGSTATGDRSQWNRCYSSRRETIGSTRAARRAGM
jgi:ketosteroid isomerase-like protein